MQATRTSLRGVGRIDEGAFKASGQGLVFARLGHNLLRDAVVRVCDKSILPSRDTPQHTPGCATAVGLQTGSCLLELSFLVAHKLRRVESIVKGTATRLTPADGQTRLLEVTLESQRARIEPQRSSPLKLVLWARG